MINSTTGYCIDILFLQLKHFPSCSMNEKIGIFRYMGMVFLQFGQNDRGFRIDNLLGSLYIKTFKKLP